MANLTNFNMSKISYMFNSKVDNFTDEHFTCKISFARASRINLRQLNGFDCASKTQSKTSNICACVKQTYCQI